jgi:hypothetical protein
MSSLTLKDKKQMKVKYKTYFENNELAEEMERASS